ncbi:hypothetical protein D1816_00020 [Aquimarina sp. AD10]|uniref:Lipoprotein n=1 Tax=Aquimarina aggregata TaxID=1642818 RepID=A0A163BTQ3_9FLAO|nr:MULTISPECIES: hypothetical protein [Aquimarina]AXT58800.1 hypothetical protein D1816_00020 [Aquimarina sp. AD10]KZS41753.1 hypothetical protein AWE51_20375 [Aquimarina aggregata]RKM99724.1 hypothetical protein D7033_11195 [Aquimarina sp. AD10]
MILFKHISKYILLVILFFTIGCSSDSPNEDQQPEETSVEDFANFAEDPKFLEHMENLVLVLNRIEDHEKALEILETSGKSKLNDTQQMELTTALGFEDTEQMNTAYDQLTEEWGLLSRRFDLSNQNYSYTEALMFNKLLLIRYNLDLSEVLGLKKKDLDNEEVHCYYEVCFPPYSNALKPYDTARLVCDAIDYTTTEGNEAYLECVRPIKQRFALELQRADFLLACCGFYRCNLERPTVLGTKPFDYSKCPEVPLS